MGILDNTVQQTALYELHLGLNAKMVQFGGYVMPVSYPEGIQSEYFAVRNEAGLFDVSHMGEFLITGKDTEDFLQRMTINDVNKLNVGQAQYSAMCYEDGGIVDDLILYRKSDGYLMVVNAANIEKDFDWLSQNISDNLTLDNLSEEYSMIAIQGPYSRDILSQFTDINLHLPFYTFKEGMVCGFMVMVSRTGYTGELGFEIFGGSGPLVHIWDQLVKGGVKPAGLAARDILRLEMAYCLYGNDINDRTNPMEAGLSWITAMDKGDFIGFNKIEEEQSEKSKRRLISFTMEERGIPRSGYEVYIEGKNVGFVTSGTQSPTLNTGIGLAYVDTPFNKVGQQISIQIRNKHLGAFIIKPPFIKDTSLHH